jgi:nucleoside-diphosphate-sugar epimerase
LVEASKRAGVKRFVYASSSSVYGVSSKSNVTEDHPLVPLTLYNKYKGMCEPILFSHTSEHFEGVIFRPATVCGFSPRQRLDLSVNILTNLAINNRRITVFGGEQMRPNLHIQDYCDVVKLLLVADSSKIKNQIFNVGAENLTILEIANKVKNIVEQQFKGDPISIEMTKSDDNRSYHINSDKIFNILGYKPKLSLEQAVLDLCNAFKDGLIPNSLSDESYFNVKSLKKLNIR